MIRHGFYWLYVSERLWKNGEPFKIYKLRTMEHGADKVSKDKYSDNGVDQYERPNGDPRVINSRRFCRKFHLDELPQIINFLKGDLKLVGLRPKPSNLWENYPKDHGDRVLKQKPGLWGVLFMPLMILVQEKGLFELKHNI